MIAGIVVFVAAATSVAFGSPCGCSGSIGLIRSSPVVSSLSSGFATPVFSSSCGSSVVPTPIVGSSCGSSVVATPSFVSPSFSPIVSSIGTSIAAPVTSGCNSVVGTGLEVVATEAVAPSYSTLVSPVSSGILSSGFCGGASAPIVAAPVASPVLTSSIASPLIGSSCGSSSLLSSGLGSSVVVPSGLSSVGSYVRPTSCSPAVSTVVSAPVVEPVSVATPIVSSISSPVVSSGVLGSGNLFIRSGCGC